MHCVRKPTTTTLFLPALALKTGLATQHALLVARNGRIAPPATVCAGFPPGALQPRAKVSHHRRSFAADCPVRGLAVSLNLRQRSICRIWCRLRNIEMARKRLKQCLDVEFGIALGYRACAASNDDGVSLTRCILVPRQAVTSSRWWDGFGCGQSKLSSTLGPPVFSIVHSGSQKKPFLLYTVVSAHNDRA